jgi:hypothetical protein
MNEVVSRQARMASAANGVCREYVGVSSRSLVALSWFSSTCNYLYGYYRYLWLFNLTTRCRPPKLSRSSFLWATMAEDLSADLLPELSEFSSGADIRQFLARLLVLVTKGRISPRRASVLAYITNQLLHSHRAIIHESKFAEEEPRIIIDMPRPDRDDWPKPRPANPTYEDLRT